ncbi:helix-turn-helix domain-containing protein [Methanosphaera sp.]
MKKIIKLYEYKFNPTQKQIEELEKSFFASRLVYNKCLEKYEKDSKTNNNPQYYGNKYFYNILEDLKENYPLLHDINQSILINSYHNLISDIKEYKRGINTHPEYKKYSKNQSVVIKNNYKNYILPCGIYISEYGLLKLNETPLTEKILQYIIRREEQQWYIGIIYEKRGKIKHSTTVAEIKINLEQYF